MDNLDNQTYDITPLRGSAIGRVSGLKGGALCGALLGGVGLALVGSEDGRFSIILFTLIFGLLTGLMAGALGGFIYGLFCGWIHGYSRGNDQAAVKYIWWLVGVPLAWWLGSLLLAELGLVGGGIGAGIGLLAATISQRDFRTVMSAQASDQESI